MSDPTMRPIWTPDDVVDAARTASEHRAYSAVPADLLDDAEYLDYLDAQPPITPPAGWARPVRYRAPGAPGMRPGRARAIGRVCVATAVAILVAVAYVLWIAAVPR